MRAYNGRLWDTICSGQVEIRSLTRDKLEDSLNVLEGSVFRYEPICFAVEINRPENATARSWLRGYAREIAQDGLSLIAVVKSTGNPVAVAFNKMMILPRANEEFIHMQFPHNNSLESLMYFMRNCDDEFEFFIEEYDLDCNCDIMFLGTLPQWGHKGIGKALTKYTIKLATELRRGQGLEQIHPYLRLRRPKAVTGLFTSLYSQHIAESLCFEILNFISYSEFSFEGITYSERIGPLHEGCFQAAYFLENFGTV